MDKVIEQMSLEYWVDEGWYIGRLKESPDVFSQGESLAELEENIRDAYQLVYPSTCSTSRRSISSAPPET